MVFLNVFFVAKECSFSSCFEALATVLLAFCCFRHVEESVLNVSNTTFSEMVEFGYHNKINDKT